MEGGGSFASKAALSDAIKRRVPFRFGKRAPIPFRFGKRAPIPFRFGKRAQIPLRFGKRATPFRFG